MIDISMRPIGKIFEQAAQPIIKEILKANVSALTGIIRSAVIEKTPVNTGALRNSIMEDTLEAPDGTIIGRVGTNIEYALPVEFGSRPHFPPIDPLTYWARRKFGLSEAEARNVAFAVAHKIAKKGTKAYRMFEHGYKEGEKQAKRISQEIGIEIEKAFK